MPKFNPERVESNESKMKSLTAAWFVAFNKHDINALLWLYDDNAKHFSPRLRDREPETSGYIQGKDALRKWWAGAFNDIPKLQYAVLEVNVDGDTVHMKYKRIAEKQKDSIISETLTIKNGKIVSSSVDTIEDVPEKKIYDPLPYETPEELDAIEKTRQARRIKSMVGEKYLYTQTNTEIFISKSNSEKFTLTMENKETGAEQVIDYHKFMAMVQSGAIKKG